MSTTITVRADPSLRAAIKRRADAQAKTVSAVVREILEAALHDRPIHSRAGHLKGRLELPKTTRDPWRNRLRQRNWRS
jgi:plasmid stability protein